MVYHRRGMECHYQLNPHATTVNRRFYSQQSGNHYSPLTDLSTVFFSIFIHPFYRILHFFHLGIFLSTFADGNLSLQGSTHPNKSKLTGTILRSQTKTTVNPATNPKVKLCYNIAKAYEWSWVFGLELDIC